MNCIKWRVLWRWVKFKDVRINTQVFINKFWFYLGPPSYIVSYVEFFPFVFSQEYNLIFKFWLCFNLHFASFSSLLFFSSSFLSSPLPVVLFLRFYLFIFRERGREREREGEKHWCERETSTSWLSCAPNRVPIVQPRQAPHQNPISDQPGNRA